MLKKSNAFKFLIATFALALFAVSTAYAAMDFGSATLRVGSKGEYVKTLQTLVGASPVDGIFGNGTKLKVMAWQTNNGLTADGVFGAMSKAKANAGGSAGSYPAGCSSATGYSSTTGLPCSGGSSGTYPAGCTSNVGFSTTTGMSCSGQVVTTGSNGYLTDIASDSTNRVSTVYESEQDKVVAGFRATARLSSQDITRVRVTFVNTNTSSSANLGKYISGVSLWMGSTKLATMSVAQASRGTSDDIYTFNFAGLSGAKIAQDQVGRFYVSVNANGALDTTDATNANWTVKFLAGGVSATSPDGTYDTYPTNDITQTGLLFGKFSSSGVKSELTLSSSNPAATVIPVNATTVTNGVTVLKFKVKATNSNLTLRKVPVQIVLTSGTAADDVTNVINTIKLMQGTNVVDSKSGTDGYQVTAGSLSTTANACVDTANAADDACAFFFSNLSSPYNMISAGTEAEYSVVIDFKSQANYATGTTVTASFVNADVLSSTAYSVQDTNGDQLPNNSTVRVGSAVGNIMTLRVNGLQATMGTASVVTTVRGGDTNPTDIIRAVYTIPVSFQAFGQTSYIGQTGAYGAAAANTGATAQAVSFGIQKASAPTTTVNAGNLDTNVAVTASSFTCSAPVEGVVGAYRVDSGGSAINCTLTVTLNNASGNAAAATESYRVQLNDVRFFSANDLTTGAANQTLLPTTSYQTGYATGVSKS